MSTRDARPHTPGPGRLQCKPFPTRPAPLWSFGRLPPTSPSSMAPSSPSSVSVNSRRSCRRAVVRGRAGSSRTTSLTISCAGGCGSSAAAAAHGRRAADRRLTPAGCRSYHLGSPARSRRALNVSTFGRTPPATLLSLPRWPPGCRTRAAPACRTRAAPNTGRPGLCTNGCSPAVPYRTPPRSPNHVRGCTGSSTNIAAWTVNTPGGSALLDGALRGWRFVDCSVWFADHVCCALAPLQLGFH